MYRDLNIVKWLLSKNADPYIPDNSGITPLAKAKIEGQILIVDTIRRYQMASVSRS